MRAVSDWLPPVDQAAGQRPTGPEDSPFVDSVIVYRLFSFQLRDDRTDEEPTTIEQHAASERQFANRRGPQSSPGPQGFVYGTEGQPDLVPYVPQTLCQQARYLPTLLHTMVRGE